MALDVSSFEDAAIDYNPICLFSIKWYRTGTILFVNLPVYKSLKSLLICKSDASIFTPNLAGPEIDIQKLKTGNKAEFARFINTYKNRVFSTCISFIPNRQDAEDLSQEVFIEVYSSITSFKENAQLSTWLYRIAVNKSLEELRRRKQLKRAAFFKGLLGIESEVFEISGDRLDHPGFIAEHKEKADALYQAIEGLPENQRIAFTLTQIEGRSYDESAEIMGSTKSSIESLIFRARNNLRKKLDDQKK